MNFINKGLLGFALLPASLYRRWGVDIAQLKSILTTKLIMDDRRPQALRNAWARQKEKPVKAATLITMFVCILMGAVYLYAFLFGSDIISQLTLYFLFFIFAMSATLISDFTSVLIDVRDNYIIFPKPVNDRTVVVARLLHIFIHVCKLMIPMALPGLIYMVINTDIYGTFLFFLMILLCTVLSIFLINAVYIFILKITTPQRFQSIISYFQIVFAVVTYGSYQLAPRLIGKYEGIFIDFSSRASSLLLPSYWFASGWKVLHQFSGQGFEWIGLGFSLCVPVASMYLIVKYLAPSFNRKLSMISSSGGEPVVSAKTGTISKPLRNTASTYTRSLAQLFTRKGAERTGFLFTWKMTGRSKDFKMKVYPSFGYMIVWLGIMVMQSRGIDLNSLREQTAGGKKLLLGGIYLCSYLLLFAINQLPFTEKYKAAWIYFVAPVEKPGAIISGGIKAAMLKFCLPIIVLVCLPLTFIAGPSMIPNIILGISNQLLIAALITFIGFKQLPFSLFQSNQQRSGSFLRGIVIMFILAVIIIAHYLVFSITPVVYVFAVMSIAATWYLLDSIRNIGWKTIKGSYTD